jgi:alanine racemase
MNERALARVDLAAVERNCARLRRALSGGSELCAVVKADGYGHGALRCAGAALAGGATRLAVATAREAAELREAHPQAAVLTMGALSAEEVDVALAAGSDIAAWRAESLALIADRAREAGRAARVHVKHDSGMGRLGNPDPEQVLALAASAAADPDLELAGIWTHLATADEPGGFLATQLEAFAAVASVARERHPGVLLHAANSAATLAEPASHYDMVRCGIAVYGLDPFGEDSGARELEPALSLHSYVADVKRFEPGDSAGYGRTWRAPERTWVGVLPIGYGDGVRRGLSNNADVLVGGRRRPLVGTVSMDNVTVDLGPETDVSPGDPAVLIGSQGGERISAEELGARLGTINYEVTCGISARVPREYG